MEVLRIRGRTGQGKKRFARPDLLLIGCLLLFGFGCFLFRSCTAKTGKFIKITVDGQDYGTFQLMKDHQEIPIQIAGKVTNTLKISNGQAKMVQADCPDKLCMHQRAISRQGETIVCLPNKIVVEVSGGKDAALDSITR